MLTVLPELYNKEKGVGQFAIETNDGKKLHLHQFVLAACLGFFEALFSFYGVSGKAVTSCKLQYAFHIVDPLFRYIYDSDKSELEARVAQYTTMDSIHALLLFDEMLPIPALYEYKKTLVSQYNNALKESWLSRDRLSDPTMLKDYIDELKIIYSIDFLQEALHETIVTALCDASWRSLFTSNDYYIPFGSDIDTEVAIPWINTVSCDVLEYLLNRSLSAFPNYMPLKIMLTRDVALTVHEPRYYYVVYISFRNSNDEGDAQTGYPYDSHVACDVSILNYYFENSPKRGVVSQVLAILQKETLLDVLRDDFLLAYQREFTAFFDKMFRDKSFNISCTKPDTHCLILSSDYPRDLYDFCNRFSKFSERRSEIFSMLRDFIPYDYPV